MENLSEHIANQPAYIVFGAIAIITLVFSVPYFLNQQKRYGSAFYFASRNRVYSVAMASIALVVLFFYGVSPYTPPPTDEIAVVVGNTQNTPAPKFTGDASDTIKATMLQHKGDDVFDIVDSIKFISAVSNPNLINIASSDVKLRGIGNNSSNAKRSAELNLKALEHKLNESKPNDNGANYLEAILLASDNVDEKSTIIVLGSGLSDTGLLNFSKINLLNDEKLRQTAIDTIVKKYGSNRLDGYRIEFFGLGDTTKPQEPLSTLQKQNVRDLYRAVMRSLGADVEIDTKTIQGDPVSTTFVVGTTDTGCGDIGLIFNDDDNLKFIGNQSTFIDEAAAKKSLLSIKRIWDKYSANISSIQVEGYTAHYDGTGQLSQNRADKVKEALIGFGIPEDKIKSQGKGFGPYKTDAQNRLVKVTISRDAKLCQD